jgi:uncharacterized protein (TIGR02466 family)
MIENLFSVPIYKVDLNNDIVQQQFENVYADLKNNNKLQYNDEWNSHKLSDITFEQNLINEYHLHEFRSEIAKHLEIYLSQIKFDKPSYWKIVECWMTEYSKGDFAHIHTHVPADVSGVYYVKSNSNDGRVFFMDPNQQVNTFVYRHLGDRKFYTPKVGTLILFPSYLNHGVEPNRTDDERVSVAFNVHFMRDRDRSWKGVPDQ